MHYVDKMPVRQKFELWQETNGTADPRLMLDAHFWSFILKANISIEDAEIWCNSVLGNEHWTRIFRKFWFTNRDEYVMFSLVWSEG